MTSSDYRTYGWFYTLLGAILFTVALAMLFDPNATQIKLGALIVCPIMVIRGLYFLRLYYTDPEVRTPPFPLPSNPLELYGRLIRDGSPVKAVKCAGCQGQYVYIPGRAAQFQAEKLGQDVARAFGAQAILADRALAPCPQCGYIQLDMVACCPSSPFVKLWMYVGIFSSFFAALLFAYLTSKSLDSSPNRGDSPLLIPWAIFGFLAILGAGSFYISWLLQKRRDPNSEPQAKRLRLGKQVSLARGDYEQLLQTVKDGSNIENGKGDIENGKGDIVD